jgi:hypothetical protein
MVTPVRVSAVATLAARAAGARVMGHANRPWKTGPFRVADAVVSTMGDVALASPTATESWD